MPDRAEMTMDADARELSAFFARIQRRVRAAGVLLGVAAGAAAGGGSLAVLRASGMSPSTAGAIALAIGVVIAALVSARAWRRATLARAAAAAEARSAETHNLLVTAEAMGRWARPVHPSVAEAIVRQAGARARAIQPSAVVPLRAAATLAAVAVAGTAIIAALPPRTITPLSQATRSDTPADVEPGRIRSVQVRVEPPGYTRLEGQTLADPREVRVFEGSRVTLEVVAPGVPVVDAIAPGGPEIRLEASGDRHVAAFTARETRYLVIRPHGRSDDSRLLSVLVQPDGRPRVRIRTPGRDLAFPTPEGKIPVEIEASDDVRLEDVELRFTHVTGSGETFTFKEGTAPVRITRETPGEWRAAGELSLGALGMEIGDTLVYRALARDGRPGADPVASESFIVEVGAVAGAASAGFALPDDRERQAISQQMVIVKTERLERDRSQMAREAFEEQARLLAVEQRMVRAEFVFMTGGEVQDEVAEAEHSHDLAEGRFENEAQVELLAAIREMSRAEAALNDADTARALPLERAALAALQRAFDRRRYFLRTVPERARIDLARRLSGERDDARSWQRPVQPAGAPQELEDLTAAMSALTEALTDPAQADMAALAARVGAIAAEDEEVRGVVARLVAAGDVAAREAVIRDAMRVVAARAERRLAPAPRRDMPADPLEGAFTDEMRNRSGGGAR